MRKLLTDVITKWVKEVKKINFSGGKEQKTKPKAKEKPEKESK